MLRLLQQEDDALLEFCKRDVFGTRIAAYMAIYGTEYPFAMFYLQESNNSVTAAVCKVDDAMTICCAPDADYEELTAFVNAIGFNTLMCTSFVCGKLLLKPQKVGFIVEFYDAPKVADSKDIILSNDVELADVYDVLSCSGFKGLAEKGQWLADVSLRVKKGAAKAKVVKHARNPVACAMVLFEANQAVLIGAVATVPAFRGNGYAGALVTDLALAAKANDKRVELLCAKAVF